jgi:hypothetical protein
MKIPSSVLILVLLIVAEIPLLAANVKKRNGEVIEGEIQRTIILKERGPATFYCAVEVKDVLGIDEEGIRVREGRGLSVLGLDAKRGSEVLEAVQWFRDQKLSGKKLLMRDLPSGGQVIGSFKGFEKPCPQKKEYLLGEFRVDKQQHTIEVIPAIDINTAKGMVSVPVSEILDSTLENKEKKSETQPQELTALATLSPEETDTTEQKSFSEGQTTLAAEAEMQSATGGHNPEADVTKGSESPQDLLRSARTAFVLSVGPRPKGVGGFFIGYARKGSNANADRAEKVLKNAIRKWKVYSLVDEPSQADLVLVIREVNSDTIFGYRVLDDLSIFKGGALPDERATPFWHHAEREEFTAAGSVIRKLHQDIKKAREQNRN